MEDYLEEEGEYQSLIVGSPNIISYEKSKTIIDQMEQNICKINIGNVQGTGFFCEIPFPDKNNMFPVFITNNHIINEKLLYDEKAVIEIEIKYDGKKKLYLYDRMKYTNKDYDITIIEIKNSDGITSFLQLDDAIINNMINNKNKNELYINKTLYIIQYPNGKLSVSYGTLETIINEEKYNFLHKCSTKGGSSGSPILNLNNKIIGIHRQGLNNNNKGTFLNFPIKEFIELNYPIYNLRQFNKKYGELTNDLSSEKINIFRRLGDEAFKHLCELKFTNLKEMNISQIGLTNLKPLEKMKLDKLEVLNLSYNNTPDITPLSKVEMKELKYLDLSGMNISDINVLENVHFEKLERLYLGYNKISDINVLEKVNFKELKVLDFHNNNIIDIKVLENVQFEKLEILNFNANKIVDINILDNVKFKGLKELLLNENNISDVKKFNKVKFRKLEKLELYNNHLDGNQMKYIFQNLKAKFFK